MTKLQKLLIEQSEGREKLNTLLDVEPDKLSDEQRGEMTTLTTRAVSIEPELRAALVAEKPTETTELNNDTEARELTALISKASVADIFAATIEHRQTSGETAELQKHFKLGGESDSFTNVGNPSRDTGTGQRTRKSTKYRARCFPAKCRQFSTNPDFNG